jgi:hypothetical protein
MPTLLKPSPRQPLGCARSSASRPAYGRRIESEREPSAEMVRCKDPRQQTHSIIECAGSVPGPVSLLHLALVVGCRSPQGHRCRPR